MKIIIFEAESVIISDCKTTPEKFLHNGTFRIELKNVKKMKIQVQPASSTGVDKKLFRPKKATTSESIPNMDKELPCRREKLYKSKKFALKRRDFQCREKDRLDKELDEYFFSKGIYENCDQQYLDFIIKKLHKGQKFSAINSTNFITVLRCLSFVDCDEKNIIGNYGFILDQYSVTRFVSFADKKKYKRKRYSKPLWKNS